ncbi:MAG: DMT family transporter [Tabrizicola sp.]|uniref:DMT family transporter n=1 Tax=Tabrizicola sp. TaxID=2005166 RepID=UPI002ABB1C76|nr:DMT family transporter [Tabrizicola sp.]MDZ4087986.1 DMT family transporter [Tabrizicola sp.]
MLALGFGLTAALLWAIHDLLARKLSQGATLLPILVLVLGSGTLGLLPVAMVLGGWGRMTWLAGGVAALSGLAFAVAIGGLYKAFSLAPVRVVSPVVGAYPLLILLTAVAQGRPVSGGDWLAVLAIVIGITIVAVASGDDAPDGYAARPGVAIGWAALSAAGFAGTFALAQEATRLGSELPVMLVGRVVALATILGLMVWHKGSLAPQRGHFGVLGLMGLLDALALGLVTASGGLPRAEYASVASSLFGVLTVLLAAWFLKERVRPVQWAGIACVFGGIAALGLLGA